MRKNGVNHINLHSLRIPLKYFILKSIRMIEIRSTVTDSGSNWKLRLDNTIVIFYDLLGHPRYNHMNK